MELNYGNKEQKFMVGDVAKRLGITVKTLHHYDKLALVKPSYQSEGGRRLYSNKDIYKVYQILSLKRLGFSLGDIKEKLKPLDKPSDIVVELKEQHKQIEDKIESLIKVKDLISKLIEDMKGVDFVDWNKLAILATIRQEAEGIYWMATLFSEKLLEHTITRFDDKSALDFNTKQDIMYDKIYDLLDRKVEATGSEAQIVIKEWWQLVEEFTNGDMSLLKELYDFSKNKDKWENKELADRWIKMEDFIQKGLTHYFTTNNMEIDI